MSTPTLSATSAPSTVDAHAIAIEAYVYLYPLITMEITRRQLTNVAHVEGIKAPMNAFAHVRAFPDASFRVVVRPNFDTLYSSAFLDVSVEPVILTVPDTHGRYYLMPMLDMWTDVFASPGKRTTGTAAAHFGIAAQGWSGSLPQGVERIDAPTPYVWIIGRTQTNGPSDYAAVHAVQDGLKITPLSQWGKEVRPTEMAIDPTFDMTTDPLDLVNGMDALSYFRLGAELMGKHRPHVTDQATVARLKRIGLEAGKAFEAPAGVDLAKACTEGLQAMRERLPTMARVVDGWQMNTDTMGVYGNYYMKRAIIAMAGLGANQPEDAVYPMCPVDADGRPFDGTHKYVLHFDKAQLPPVDGFWSVTMYDNAGFQVANALSRFAIGDRDALRYNADGSLDLYVQADDPGGDKTSNWLPAPTTGFNLTARLYAPHHLVLDGGWAPPAVRRVD